MKDVKSHLCDFNYPNFSMVDFHCGSYYSFGIFQNSRRRILGIIDMRYASLQVYQSWKNNKLTFWITNYVEPKELEFDFDTESDKLYFFSACQVAVVREKKGEERQLFIFDICYLEKGFLDGYKADIKTSTREQAFKNLRKIYEIIDAYKTENESMDVLTYCKIWESYKNEPDNEYKACISYGDSRVEAVEDENLTCF